VEFNRLISQLGVGSQELSPMFQNRSTSPNRIQFLTSNP